MRSIKKSLKINSTITYLDIGGRTASEYIQPLKMRAKTLNQFIHSGNEILKKNKQYEEIIDFVEGRYVVHELGTNFYDIHVDFEIIESINKIYEL